MNILMYICMFLFYVYMYVLFYVAPNNIYIVIYFHIYM